MQKERQGNAHSSMHEGSRREYGCYQQIASTDQRTALQTCLIPFFLLLLFAQSRKLHDERKMVEHVATASLKGLC